jgi:hypothetical protein
VNEVPWLVWMWIGMLPIAAMGLADIYLRRRKLRLAERERHHSP